MATIPRRILEIRAGLPGALGRSWTGLFMRAKIERVTGSAPNKAEVTLHNLDALSIKILQTPDYVLHVLASPQWARPHGT